MTIKVYEITSKTFRACFSSSSTSNIATIRRCTADWIAPVTIRRCSAHLVCPNGARSISPGLRGTSYPG